MKKLLLLPIIALASCVSPLTGIDYTDPKNPKATQETPAKLTNIFGRWLGGENIKDIAKDAYTVDNAK